MRERIAILGGVRTPIGKVGGIFKKLTAVDLGVHVVKECLARVAIEPREVEEVIFGNVAQPIDAANVARVIALQAGLPTPIPAFTVHRNCASGMQAITSGAERILAGNVKICLAGGVEAMSQIPLLYNDAMTEFFYHLSNPRLSLLSKLRLLTKFRLHNLRPIIGLVRGLRDPICGLNMGETAEVLAKEFAISRADQDHFALRSHHRATAAQAQGYFAAEIHPIFTPAAQPAPSPHPTVQLLSTDEGPRAQQSLAHLGKLRPYFDKYTGTVTVGNACPVNDGAAAVILMTEKEAKKRQLKPLGYLRAYSYAALAGERMGLGPTFATKKLIATTRIPLKKFDLIEINEAFAAQVIANIKACASRTFAKKNFADHMPLGELDETKLNVNGGAIALGHPVGMTGTRLVIHLLKELHRRKKIRGLATLCVGGGQGAALALETR